MNYKIITPVTTEPVTLAEAKAHPRLTSDTFDGDVTVNQSILPGSHVIAASLLGAAIDVQGLVSMVSLNAGTCGSGGSVAVKIQESDDNITFTDWTGGAFTTVTTANDNAVYEKSYTGVKQYIRAHAVIAGASCEFSVDIITKTGDSTEDDLITALITSAREYCEGFTRRAFATQTIEAYPQRFPCKNEIELPHPPLQSVTSVKYKDSARTETTMTVDTDYIVDLESDVGRIVLPYGISWPSFTPYPVNPIKIRYTAGYTALNPIPTMFKQAMLLLIGHWYANREAASTGAVSKEIEFAVRSLLSMGRAGWF